jgi:hypothetical protein
MPLLAFTGNQSLEHMGESGWQATTGFLKHFWPDTHA